MKIFIFILLTCCTLAPHSQAAKGIEITHETQLCCADVYLKDLNNPPPQGEIDNSNKERTSLTFQEQITLTATLDGKEIPEGKQCTWSIVKGSAYFELEQNKNKSWQAKVIINSQAGNTEKISVKVAVDGQEKEMELTVIPAAELRYEEPINPYQPAIDAAAKQGATEGQAAIRVLRIYPTNVSFANLYSLEKHIGDKPNPLPKNPLVAPHVLQVMPKKISTSNEIYDLAACLYPKELIAKFTGTLQWTWQCNWSIFGCKDKPTIVNDEPQYNIDREIFGFDTDQNFTIHRNPVTKAMSYTIQKFSFFDKKGKGIITTP